MGAGNADRLVLSVYILRDGSNITELIISRYLNLMSYTAFRLANGTPRVPVPAYTNVKLGFLSLGLQFKTGLRQRKN